MKPNKTENIKINWGKPITIPPAKGRPVQFGVAGAIAGISHQHLIIAGGANFEDFVPWKGGTKQYHNVVYMMETGLTGKENWREAASRLPQKQGYSACVSWNNQIISLGGENDQGLISNVWRIEMKDHDIQCLPLTSLPYPVTGAGSALIENTLYLAGGIDPAGGSANFIRARLDQPTLKWKELAPLPMPLSHAVVVSQHDGHEMCIYVIGGRNKTGVVSTFYSSIWKYAPSTETWIKAGELTNAKRTPMGLSAGTGISAGDHHIVLFGGDPGIVFNRTERFLDAIAKSTNDEEKKRLTDLKNQGQENHPGFLRDVLIFNTLTGTIHKSGLTSHPAQVTTQAVVSGDTVYIPSGEVKPGMRTAMVSKATIRKQ